MAVVNAVPVPFNTPFGVVLTASVPLPVTGEPVTENPVGIVNPTLVTVPPPPVGVYASHAVPPEFTRIDWLAAGVTVVSVLAELATNAEVAPIDVSPVPPWATVTAAAEVRTVPVDAGIVRV